MSKKNLKLLLKYLSFTAIFYLICGFQTSFWPEIIPFLPAPALWIIFIVFISLRWPTTPTLFYIYFLGFIMTLFSSIPLKMSWLGLICLYGISWIFKKRFNSSSLFTFAVTCSVSYLFYVVCFYLISMWLEPRPTSALFLDRTLEMGLIFLVSAPFYVFLNKVDTYFKDTEIWSAQNIQSNSFDQGEF